MLAKRVMVLLTLSSGQLVRTKRFVIDRWYSLEFAGLGEADEIVVVDVTAGGPDRVGTARTIRRLIEDVGVPVTLGGGLRTLEDARWAFAEAGADKVLSSDAAFCSAVSGKYGAQAAVYGFELDRGIMLPNDQKAEMGVKAGAGELLVQDVGRDGSLQGYGAIPRASVPVVIGSGCGNWFHMIEGFRAGADGCATSNVLHFSASALRGFKEKIRAAGIAVRP